MISMHLGSCECDYITSETCVKHIIIFIFGSRDFVSSVFRLPSHSA